MASPPTSVLLLESSTMMKMITAMTMIKMVTTKSAAARRRNATATMTNPRSVMITSQAFSVTPTTASTKTRTHKE